MSPFPDPKAMFSSCYREGPSCTTRCIRYLKDNKRCCNKPISREKMEEHHARMVRLNRLPLQERAGSPILVEATRLLLCHHHVDSHLSDELEKARKKFRDAASEEARKKKEEETEKQIEVQREADKKEEEVTPTLPTTQAPQAPYAPHTLLTPPTLLTSPAPRTSSAPPLSPTPPATLQITDEFPSESDSESDSDDEDEDQGTSTVDPWTAYQTRWKEVIDNGVRERTPLEYQIPWPIVSGHLADVDHVQVRGFFNQVVKGNSLEIGKMLYYELARWERSSLKKRFGRSAYRMHKPQFKLILAVVREGTEKFWSEQ